MTARRAIAALACALLALAAVPRPAAADDVINVMGGTYPPSINDIDGFVAEGMGYFKDEHLIVNKQYAGTASVCFQEVAIGKGDVCTGFVEPVILGYPKGLHLVIFLNHNARFDYRLAVLDESPIKRLADFKGANIGEITHGGTGEIPADVTLSGAGLRPSDYTYTPIGLGPQALAAITAKKVDGVIFPLQEIETMEAVGKVKFRTFTDPRFADVPSEGFTTTPETLAAKADLLKRYARAMVKAFIFMRVNPQAAARFYLQGTNQKVTPELLASITGVVEAMEPEFPAYNLKTRNIGYMSADGLQQYCKMFFAAGRTPVLVPGADLVTNQFVDYANAFDHQSIVRQARATP
jgi:NitT/TauT family transport system substrate-binding protein